MRISTSSIYSGGTNRLSELQTTLDKTMQQISTGRRILTPSDDAVAAARVLDVSQSQSINEQFGANRKNAASSLSQVDATLQGVTDLLQDAKTLIVQAGNTTLTDADRSSIATDLRSRFDQLLGLANTTDGAGNYLFSGYKITTQPFVQTATGVQYQGDQGQQLLQVSASRKMAISDSGQSVFQAGSQDVFKTLNDVITLLQKPVSSPVDISVFSAGIAVANAGVDKSLDNMLTIRASVGSRLAEIDSLDNVGSARDLLYKKNLADLQDLDYNEAISNLSQKKITLEAAQKSFVTITGLSLFNYIS